MHARARMWQTSATAKVIRRKQVRLATRWEVKKCTKLDQSPGKQGVTTSYGSMHAYCAVALALQSPALLADPVELHPMA